MQSEISHDFPCQRASSEFRQKIPKKLVRPHSYVGNEMGSSDYHFASHEERETHNDDRAQETDSPESGDSDEELEPWNLAAMGGGSVLRKKEILILKKRNPKKEGTQLP